MLLLHFILIAARQFISKLFTFYTVILFQKCFFLKFCVPKEKMHIKESSFKIRTNGKAREMQRFVKHSPIQHHNGIYV